MPGVGREGIRIQRVSWTCVSYEAAIRLAGGDRNPPESPPGRLQPVRGARAMRTIHPILPIAPIIVRRERLVWCSPRKSFTNSCKHFLRKLSSWAFRSTNRSQYHKTAIELEYSPK